MPCRYQVRRKKLSLQGQVSSVSTCLQDQHSLAVPMLIQPHIVTGTSALPSQKQRYFVCCHFVGISTDIYLSSLPSLYCDSCSILIKQHMTNTLLLTVVGELINLATAPVGKPWSVIASSGCWDRSDEECWAEAGQQHLLLRGKNKQTKKLKWYEKD